MNWYATEGRIRKQKQEQEYRRAELQEAIITWTLSSLAVLVGLGIVITGMYFLGIQQGKW
jgi:hypothetical protein